MQTFNDMAQDIVKEMERILKIVHSEGPQSGAMAKIPLSIRCVTIHVQISG